MLLNIFFEKFAAGAYALHLRVGGLEVLCELSCRLTTQGMSSYLVHDPLVKKPLTTARALGMDGGGLAAEVVFKRPLRKKRRIACPTKKLWMLAIVLECGVRQDEENDNNKIHTMSRRSWS